MTHIGTELEDFRKQWKDEIQGRKVNPPGRQGETSKRLKKAHQQRECLDIWPQHLEQVGQDESGAEVSNLNKSTVQVATECGLSHSSRGRDKKANKGNKNRRHKVGADTVFESRIPGSDGQSCVNSRNEDIFCSTNSPSYVCMDSDVSVGCTRGVKRPDVCQKVDYFYIAESLLEGRTSPLQNRIEEENNKSEQKFCGSKHHSVVKNARNHHLKPQREELVDVLIQDLVSKTWKVLAEDEVLWYRLCQQEGHHASTDISEYPCWKAILRDCRNKEHTLTMNWKNRVGAVSQLQYDLGKVLCDVHSCNGVVVAGYTSGDVRLWDIRTWDCTASHLEPALAASEPGSRPHVAFVRINCTLAAAAYEDGTVNVWSTVFKREPVHHFKHNQGLQALALGLNSAAVATASASEVHVESPDEKGYWKSALHYDVQKQISFLQLVPDSGSSPTVVVTADDTVYLLKPHEEPRTLHTVYGNSVTCLDVSSSLAAFGVRSFGWLMNDGNKVLIHCLRTGQCLASLGNSAGDYTCINLRDSPPNLVVTGNKDRRVRVYDLRTSKSVNSLHSHHLLVSCVQMDDWKVVSGGTEGLVCVWDWRMGTKLWEMHARHPVRHILFNAHTLVTANIPDEKCPRGASIMDDDLTAHRRHRGTIYVYDFLMDRSSPEGVLPICRSSYDESTGYSYNIALSMPYDTI
ncbi:F-box/WD repeat-containing protein 8 isoform X2 [Protopterus annectens]|uniref:F-box/WD repeat-containing protein 8 isoform X2 n=1 Tax=Protopterus annectens TaxID=7888 RepID=UPI001CFA2959|nr:F-box/WD repeat-containing protein 8 isoform X2 [Protopterus annectens]